MTEEELLDDFEVKVRRYLTELGLSSIGGAFSLASANVYYDAAQNLGASLLLRMVEALRERDSLRQAVEALKEQAEAERTEQRAQVHELAAKIEAATTTELAKANDELRATVRQAEAMEYAGCDAIAALRAVEGNPGLPEAQHALVAEALLGMFAAKPRWLSRPTKLEGGA